jgi:hypothetical protein
LAQTVDLWLDCWSEAEIGKQIGRVDQATISRWLADAKSAFAENASPPPSRQHFDIVRRCSPPFASARIDDLGCARNIVAQRGRSIVFAYSADSGAHGLALSG